jgi:diaminopimelate epimerase
MQTLLFYKYQGTGNDFVMIDNRDQNFKNNTKLIKELCDRKFGIGADGLICLENSNDSDFKMVYYNADGNESSMCGNGGRCIVAFAKYLNIIDDSCEFMAIDGLHEANIDKDMNVELKMKDVDSIKTYELDFVLDTGSPHYVRFVEDINFIDTPKQGSIVRYSDDFKAEGINVNFAEFHKNRITMSTYERGVEDETLSCGTGVTAVALSASYKKLVKGNTVTINTKGGTLKVKFEKTANGYENIYLIGPTKKVYKGEIEC